MLSPVSRLLIASVGKTVTAAQVLHLVDEGQLELDDLAAEHFPPEIAFFDANGATVRELLGMRSGIADPPGYISLVDSGSTPAELVEGIGGPALPRRISNLLRKHQLRPARVDYRARHRGPAVGSA